MQGRTARAHRRNSIAGFSPHTLHERAGAAATRAGKNAPRPRAPRGPGRPLDAKHGAEHRRGRHARAGEPRAAVRSPAARSWLRRRASDPRHCGVLRCGSPAGAGSHPAAAPAVESAAARLPPEGIVCAKRPGVRVCGESGRKFIKACSNFNGKYGRNHELFTTRSGPPRWEARVKLGGPNRAPFVPALLPEAAHRGGKRVPAHPAR